MLKRKIKKVFVTALAATLVIGCFTVTASAMQIPTQTITYPAVKVQYSAHVQGKGWMSFVSDGQTAGTTGLSLRMEAIMMNLTNVSAGAGITYSIYEQDKGWMPAVSDGETAGSVGQSKRTEAIKINLYGLPGYSVEYRVHVQNIGWMDWQKDGALAGTIGQSLRMEAIEIRVIAPQIEIRYAPEAPQAIDIESVDIIGFDNVDMGINDDSYKSLTQSSPSPLQYTVTSLTWEQQHEYKLFYVPQGPTFTGTVTLTSAPGYKFPEQGITSEAISAEGQPTSDGTTSGGNVSGNTLTFQLYIFLT